MRKGLNQILSTIRDGQEVRLKMATNQDGGHFENIISYTEAVLYYRGPNLQHGVEARLATKADLPARMYFNDRGFFKQENLEKVGIEISVSQSDPHTAHLSFDPASFGGEKFAIALEERSNVLIGEGPSLGQSSAAIYLFSFDGPFGEHPPQ